MEPMDVRKLRERVERHIRGLELIPPRGEVTCLVSGGADSTCLWHVLGELGYRVSALHVAHGLRGAESAEDARFCRDVLGAEVVDAPPGRTEDELRRLRYSFGTDRLRATGHTASDQVETVLYRLVSSGRPGGISAKRADGVVRPLLDLWREETEAYCAAAGLSYRLDTSNARTKRGLIRTAILPLLEELDPRARANLLALATQDERPRLPRRLEQTLLELLAARDGTKEADLGDGIRAVREYDRISLERGPVRFGPWEIASDLPGLEVRTRRPGDRLRGRGRKIQDVFVDAKVPRRERDGWPLVVHEGEVVAVPGIVETDGVEWEKHEPPFLGRRSRASRRRRQRRRLDGAAQERRRRLCRCRSGGAWVTTRTELERGVGEVLIDEATLQTRIAELGEEISAFYQRRDPLLVGVLKGAVFFMSDLMRHLTVPCEVDFMAISSYGAATDSSGVVRILKDLDINIEGRHVLVVEDIIDSGLTLSYLIRNLESREPASLEVAALLTKPARREIDVPVRWVGFEIPNRFVIGYGLDFAERYRNLPYVGVLSEDLIPEGV